METISLNNKEYKDLVDRLLYLLQAPVEKRIDYLRGALFKRRGMPDIVFKIVSSPEHEQEAIAVLQHSALKFTHIGVLEGDMIHVADITVKTDNAPGTDMIVFLREKIKKALPSCCEVQ